VAKRRYKKQEKRQKMLDRGYTECKKCGELSQPGALMCPGCHKLSHTGMKVLAVGVALIVVAAALGIYFTQPDDSYRNPTAIYSVSPTSASASTSSQITVTFTRPMDKSSVEAAFSTSPYVLGTISWSGLALVFTPSTALDEGVTYTVTIGSSAVDSEGEALDCGMFSWNFVTSGGAGTIRDIGTGADDFWYTYPSTHPDSGAAVSHPIWVLDALANGPVMALVHSEGCSPCITQTAICEQVSADFSGQIVYFDLLSGTDEPEASQGFDVYDPNGGVNYIPLLIVVTYAVNPSDGSTIVVWHSWEGVVYEDILTSWINDAITHWDEC
jgi:hypothetical protein